MFLFKWWWPSSTPVDSNVSGADAPKSAEPIAPESAKANAPESAVADAPSANDRDSIDLARPRPYMQELKQYFEKEEVQERAETVFNREHMRRQIGMLIDRIRSENNQAEKIPLLLELFDVLASDEGRSYIRCSSPNSLGRTVFSIIHTTYRDINVNLDWYYNRLFPKHRKLYPIGIPLDKDGLELAYRLTYSL